MTLGSGILKIHTSVPIKQLTSKSKLLFSLLYNVHNIGIQYELHVTES